MPEAAIVSTARTPIGTAFKGSLVDVDAFELATGVVAEAVPRTGIEPALVDDVVVGESLYGGGDIARYAAIEAGLVNAPGVSLNRHCASSLAAVQSAAASIRSGMDRVVIAGEVPIPSPPRRARPGGCPAPTTGRSGCHLVTGTRRTPPTSTWPSPSAGTPPSRPGSPARRWMPGPCVHTSRAVAAIDGGSFAEEILPIEVERRDGTTVTFGSYEHPRRDTSPEKLASLKPLHPEIEGFTITAGNAAGANDGAAAMVLVGQGLGAQLGLEPLAVVKAWASTGVPPADTGLAPTIAVPRALERAGLRADDVALWEINEAFASMCVATTRILGIDESAVNVLGSGCSLGHPIAMTGARMVISLVLEVAAPTPPPAPPAR